MPIELICASSFQDVVTRWWPCDGNPQRINEHDIGITGKPLNWTNLSNRVHDVSTYVSGGFTMRFLVNMV